jgi:hypothetical protein
MPVTFTPLSNAEVVGKDASICLVLKGGVPLGDGEGEVLRILDGVKINATITTEGGVVHEFGCLSKNWERSGRIAPSGEIAACVRSSCGNRTVPVGTKVRSVSISTSGPLSAMGVYWHSRVGLEGTGT